MNRLSKQAQANIRAACVKLAMRGDITGYTLADDSISFDRAGQPPIRLAFTQGQTEQDFLAELSAVLLYLAFGIDFKGGER